MNGYPTIKFFGSNKEKPEDYNGGRGEDNIVSFATAKWQDQLPPPQVRCGCPLHRARSTFCAPARSADSFVFDGRDLSAPGGSPRCPVTMLTGTFVAKRSKREAALLSFDGILKVIKRAKRCAKTRVWHPAGQAADRSGDVRGALHRSPGQRDAGPGGDTTSAAVLPGLPAAHPGQQCSGTERVPEGVPCPDNVACAPHQECQDLCLEATLHDKPML